MKWKDVVKQTNTHTAVRLRNLNFSNQHYQYYHIRVPSVSAVVTSRYHNKMLRPVESDGPTNWILPCLTEMAILNMNVAVRLTVNPFEH